MVARNYRYLGSCFNAQRCGGTLEMKKENLIMSDKEKDEEIRKLRKMLEEGRKNREALELAEYARDPRNQTLDWGY